MAIVNKILKGIKEKKFTKLDEEATIIKNKESGITVTFSPRQIQIEMQTEDDNKIITLSPVEKFLLERGLNKLEKKFQRDLERETRREIESRM